MPGSQSARNAPESPDPRGAAAAPGPLALPPVLAEVPDLHVTTMRVSGALGVAVAGRGLEARRLALFDGWFQLDELDEPPVLRGTGDMQNVLQVLFRDRR